jgi:hypothetical protein
MEDEREGRSWTRVPPGNEGTGYFVEKPFPRVSEWCGLVGNILRRSSRLESKRLEYF